MALLLLLLLLLLLFKFLVFPVTVHHSDHFFMIFCFKIDLFLSPHHRCSSLIFYFPFLKYFSPGGFNTELNRENHNDKKIICSYSPTEPGDYVIRVTWSGDDVPGSPFNIRIADSPAELNAYLQGTYGVSPQERYRNVQ